MVECSRVKLGQIEPNRAIAEPSQSVVEPGSAMGDCSRVQYSEV